ncbi:uncharacterized protein KY384_006338 [Bacidia gigantensis]|uniref:uncharacterized protein n=1 Tax=Bacidia gigantensis TaxID=2732470 RepID=UPI001D03FE48|nr:uncharacterized protein KY384_006338 [Bacidia gigantensis]KAG8528651.1 hypothetical protein KY384_006338 [Bacidia gigantensis]
MGQHALQHRHTDRPEWHSCWEEFSSLPVSRLLDSNVNPKRPHEGGGLTCPRFLPADALWNLAMAINVYLTIFHKYTANRLKKLEWAYLLMCYGITFIIAFVCLFISTSSRGKIYGPNVLWCSIDINWVFMRIAIVYGPAWICIAASLFLYVISGVEIFRKRAQLIAFKVPQYNDKDTRPSSTENLVTDFKTTQIQYFSEPALLRPPSEGSHDTNTTTESTTQASMTSQREPAYGVTTIISTPKRSQSDNSIFVLPQSSKANQQRKQKRAAIEFNRAALAYTKVAVLFFCSMLITWIPPSVNRFNSFLHPHQVNIPSSYATSFVLPMMGAWNSVIYIVTSWKAVQDLFAGKLGRPKWSKVKPAAINLRPGAHNSSRKASAHEVKPVIYISEFERPGKEAMSIGEEEIR